MVDEMELMVRPLQGLACLPHALRRPGGYGEGSKPDPIPNSVVKTLSADGTASMDVGE